MDSVIILIRGHARLDLLNKRGESALVLAAKKGYPEGERITRLLLRAGADPNQATPSGWTALMSAEGFNYQEPWGVSSHNIVRELLGAHAKVNVRSKEGTTPLIVAAGHPGPDDDSFVSELISAGAQINAADEDCQTALMAAAELGHVRKVRFLLSHGANSEARDKLGRTALDYARPPRNEHDDEFPQCYESIDSSYKKTNDCKATRSTLRVAMQRRP